MRKTITILLFLASVSASAQSSVKDKLLFYSRNATPATSSAVTRTVDKLNIVDTASLVFNGSAYMEYGDTLNMDTASFSISLWYKASVYPTATVGAKLVNKGLTTAGTPQVAGYGVRLINENGVNKVRFLVRGSADADYSTCTATNMPVDEWVNVVCVKKTKEISIYINGLSRETTALSQNTSLNTNIHLALGALYRPPYQTAITENFTGLLDEVKIYGKALTESEITSLNSYFFNGPQASMSGQYADFDNIIGNGDSLVVYSNTDWTIKSNAPWLTVTPTSGSGRDTIQMIVNQANPSAAKSRNDTIFIYAHDTLFFLVEQKYLYINTNPTMLEIATSDTVVVSANCAWTVEPGKSWLDADKTSGAGNDTLVFTVKGQVASNDKTGDITFTSGEEVTLIPLTFSGITNIATTRSKVTVAMLEKEIKINGLNHSSNVKIVSPTGIVMYQNKANASQLDINISELPAATYILSVDNEPRAFVKR